MHSFPLTPDVLPSRAAAAAAGAESRLRVSQKDVSAASCWVALLMCSAEDTEVIRMLLLLSLFRFVAGAESI